MGVTRSKHIHICYQFVHESFAEEKILVQHVSTNGQLANILMKPLPRIKCTEMKERIGAMKMNMEHNV
jgi:hypothetical protein